ncbi:MAG: zinc metalloprotease HtpX [Candidatus Omnitrophica bacterium]|nr:zinc metalloprotease HtpX [Candidatus Omnitrophota bacterium]
MFYLKLRMYLLLTIMFALIYMIITVIGVSIGIVNFYFYLFISLFMIFIQYLVGPKIVEWSMRVRYVDEKDAPQLHQMVEDLAKRAGIPKPKVGIARINIPNAFAFGRGISDGRVCVTQSLMHLLNDSELRAVLGHEISHLKNRDVITITLLSVIPIVLYRIAWHFMWFGQSRRQREGTNTVFVGLIAFIFYFITNLLVLYASRIREYFADRGSIMLGNRPNSLASALYKLVYGSVRTDKEELREVEGIKAFFVNDPTKAINELQELSQLDLNRDGIIDNKELELISRKRVNISFADKLLELLSTHPNMLKRIKQLSQYR